ncbi:MAG: hypothetical protein LBV61_05620 [Burkholderiaceae bacterium]|jgi:hypothetical protein|nr:hypothetical protein [Burkholderiaceae bacterium]
MDHTYANDITHIATHSASHVAGQEAPDGTADVASYPARRSIQEAAHVVRDIIKKAANRVAYTTSDTVYDAPDGIANAVSDTTHGTPGIASDAIPDASQGSLYIVNKTPNSVTYIVKNRPVIYYSSHGISFISQLKNLHQKMFKWSPYQGHPLKKRH